MKNACKVLAIVLVTIAMFAIVGCGSSTLQSGTYTESFGTITITLDDDGTLSGDYTGTWSQTSMTLGTTTYDLAVKSSTSFTLSLNDMTLFTFTQD